jgi:hypothetical protein
MIMSTVNRVVAAQRGSARFIAHGDFGFAISFLGGEPNSRRNIQSGAQIFSKT